MTAPAKHGLFWQDGQLFIDGVPANQIARRAELTGAVERAKPRHHKTPEQRAAYRLHRRAYMTGHMALLRAQRKGDPAAIGLAQARIAEAAADCRAALAPPPRRRF